LKAPDLYQSSPITRGPGLYNRPQDDFHSSDHVEGRLPEPAVELVLDDGGKPCPFGPIMQVADAEVLLDDISDFGDGLVALDLQLGELGSGGVLAHDAIFDLIECQKITVRLSSVALVGIDLFDLLFCMTTKSGAIGQEVGIVDRSWCKGGGQHKTVAGVDRRMFLQTKVGNIIFNRPVGFQVPRELKRIAFLIPLALFTVAVFALLFQLILTQGSTGGLNQAGIHGNALVDGKPLLF
jgi:hypothetical protein